jgi:hypothetical protein
MANYIPLYNSIADVGARIGPFIFGIALALMVAIFVALAVMLAHSRAPDADGGHVVSDDKPYQQPTYFTGVGKMVFRTKRKILFSRTGFVSVESIVNGTATTQERLIVLGITAAFFCMSLVMIGVGLMFMKNDPSALLAPVFGIAFFGYYVRLVWRDFRRVKEKLANRTRGK